MLQNNSLSGVIISASFIATLQAHYQKLGVTK